MALNDRGETAYSGYDYHNAVKRRLGRIGKYDNENTAFSQGRSALAANQKAFDERMEMEQAGLNSATVGYDNANSLRQYGADLMGRMNSVNDYMQQISPTTTGQLGSFINAIGVKESGNNYSAVNRHSGALGKYQIMPFNIASWSRAALGYSISPSQFLSSPQLQETIARHKLTEYYNKYGPAGAAVAWYAGPGSADRFASSGYLSRGIEAGGYPSQYSYVNSILQAMRGY